MCIDCGCAERTEQAHHHGHDHDGKTIQVGEDLLAKNDRLAAVNRQRFAGHGLLTLNLVSSPGSGKTTLLETTLRTLRAELRFAVLEGDQQTANDADRIAATGVPVHQINTGAGCHLDAHMVGHGVDHFDLANLDVLLIENVGNLVCPASFDLGEDCKVAVLSITEGEDKPLKYPQMFRAAELVIINKLDLLPHLDFDLETCRDYLRQVNPQARVIELSCKSGEGMETWYNWLREQLAKKK
ncbi:hydrogenase nickel incorporation protein HypB [Geothermobacter hydrogeniphilus]|uniref:Hydrogenase accessory protein HypB n=1 Tax=Geothermobacter hydrogeniphilus TaxID=1969733 RepID=A0A1X0Y0W5_9BACT|nr:hydrogenase nickel incorporation protein HypB [Geothermobacter hydrogeniphilus]ORJ58728.1 hydrogenase accessory protein HypB [Geothermobacter hydrogeniphilus]